ncbi:unnamed protein product, partial [Clonostachys byssicola]
ISQGVHQIPIFSISICCWTKSAVWNRLPRRELKLQNRRSRGTCSTTTHCNDRSIMTNCIVRPYTFVLLVHKYVHFSTLEEAAILPSYPRGHTRPSIPKDSNIDPTKHHQLHSQGGIGSKRTLTYHISTPEQARGAQKAD